MLEKCLLSNNGDKNIESHMSIANTTSIRGVAILAVILHHFSQYYDVSIYVHDILDHFGYLAVGVFLFLSGYGNAVSFKKKTMGIKDTIIWGMKRILSIVVSFVIIYLISFWAIKLFVPAIEYSFRIKDMITLTLPTWTNWYLKVQIGLYMLFTVLALLFQKDEIRLILLFILVAFYILFARYMGLANFWWNSILCYPMGILAEKFKNITCKLKYKTIYAVLFFAFFVVFTYLKQWNNIFGVCSCACFVLVMYLINSCRPLCCRSLSFIGKYTLEIYMVHLIVMRILLYCPVNKYMSLLLIIVISIPISVGINRLSYMVLKEMK